MEIEVGEYVRINNDFRLIALGIGKVIRINQDTIYVKMNFKLPFAFKIENIAKHSKNIIDLIEEGDFVNGYPAKRIANFNNELCNFDLNTMEWTPLKDIDVYYNILTKEQYMQNCYKTDTN